MNTNYALLIDSTEAMIYISEPHNGRKVITKIYHSNISSVKKNSEFNFLKTCQNTGYVPVLYSSMLELTLSSFIDMEYLENYITLGRAKKFLTSNDIKTSLCMELIKGRKLIGQGIHYLDLHKKNVMVKFADTYGVSVKFIDPGAYSVYYGAWKSWCMDIARELSVAKIMKKCINEIGL